MGRPWPEAGEPLFLPADTDLQIALAEQEAEEAAGKCPLCGLPREVCRDAANQFRFRANAEQCHASYAIATAQADWQDPSDAQKQSAHWSAQLRH